MNILITGGLGLIGHNVVQRLQAQGHCVSIIDTKTAAVHFLRFELTEAMIKDMRDLDCAFTVGVDHPAYNEYTRVNTLTKEMLVKDFE